MGSAPSAIKTREDSIKFIKKVEVLSTPVLQNKPAGYLDVFRKKVAGVQVKMNDKKEAFAEFGPYILLRPISEGGHLFPVHLAKKEGFEETTVLKTIEADDPSFANETNIFRLPAHQYIVKCKEVLTQISVNFGSESQVDIVLKNRDKLWNGIVTEFAPNKDLFQYLVLGPFSEKLARYYFGQLLEALNHLHANNYCHLDLKPENILLDENFCIKLTDFGFSRFIGDSKRVFERSGTQQYMSPQMCLPRFKQCGCDGAKADIFALGILLYIFVTGRPPFARAVPADVRYRAIYANDWAKFWSLKEQNKGLTFDLKALLARLLAHEESERPNIDEIKQSDWFINTPPLGPAEVVSAMSERRDKSQII